MTVVEPAAPIVPRIAPILLDLVECVCEELAMSGAGPTCWCGMYPGGEVSWEFCGGECDNAACGMGWVRLAGVAPYDVFPNAIIDLTCAKPLAWQVEVGALRCLPVPVSGEIPTSVEMNEVAMEQLVDAWALYRALQCCDGVDIAVAAYEPLGPEGACVGGRWLAWLSVD